MRCPKCGYNSFDHLEACKKCGKELAEHKARFNIQSVLLSDAPIEAASTVAEDAVAAASASPDVAIDDFSGGGADSDDFGFDFMGDSDDDENLAFDELFEEVPTEDEVEESLPAPEAAPEDMASEPAPSTAENDPMPLDQELASEEPVAAIEEPAADDFSFDESEPADVSAEPAAVSEESVVEFGFDADDDPDADIFAETEEDFSLDGSDLEDSNKS